jgi:ubiquinone/menaquinone biosynthesis C-methylase UbiE
MYAKIVSRKGGHFMKIDSDRMQIAKEAKLAPVDEPLIRALNLDAPSRIADIGCGGGGTTLEILRRAPAGSVVHGFDLSPASIELARGRKRSDECTIAFEVANMATATAPEEPYDRLVSRFGIMFFDDPLGAFANLVRWIAPGGRFAFAALGPSVRKSVDLISQRGKIFFVRLVSVAIADASHRPDICPKWNLVCLLLKNSTLTIKPSA